jgi:hypothetical protein
MARQLNPERFYTHEMIEALATKMDQHKKAQARAGDSPDGSPEDVEGMEPSSP